MYNPRIGYYDGHDPYAPEQQVLIAESVNLDPDNNHGLTYAHKKLGLNLATTTVEGTISTTAQSFAGNKTFTNDVSISGTLSAQSATTTISGLMDTTTQSFAGNKTFINDLSVLGSITGHLPTISPEITGLDSWSDEGAPHYLFGASGGFILLKVPQSFTGYIKGTKITYIETQTDVAFPESAPESLYYVGVDSGGHLQILPSADFENYIVLFAVKNSTSGVAYGHLVVEIWHPALFGYQVYLSMRHLYGNQFYISGELEILGGGEVWPSIQMTPSVMSIWGKMITNPARVLPTKVMWYDINNYRVRFSNTSDSFPPAYWRDGWIIPTHKYIFYAGYFTRDYFILVGQNNAYDTLEEIHQLIALNAYQGITWDSPPNNSMSGVMASPLCYIILKNGPDRSPDYPLISWIEFKDTRIKSFQKITGNNGIYVTGNEINALPATETTGGVLSANTQTIGGDKSFTGIIKVDEIQPEANTPTTGVKIVGATCDSLSVRAQYLTTADDLNPDYVQIGSAEIARNGTSADLSLTVKGKGAGGVNLEGPVNLVAQTASRPLKTDTLKNITSGQIDLASTNDVSGILPITNGGTGASDLGAFVQTSGNQSIGGVKTFSDTIKTNLIQSATGDLNLYEKDGQAGIHISDVNDGWCSFRTTQSLYPVQIRVRNDDTTIPTLGMTAPSDPRYACGMGLNVNGIHSGGGTAIGLFTGYTTVDTPLQNTDCKMTVSSSGNVGIGTGSPANEPAEKLEVVGNIKATNSTIIATTMSADTVSTTTMSIAGTTTLSNLTASQPLKLDVSKNIISEDISLTADVSGILPIANGGTGASDLSAIVQTTGDQSIAGVKTFSSGIKTNTITSATGDVNIYEKDSSYGIHISDSQNGWCGFRTNNVIYPETLRARPLIDKNPSLAIQDETNARYSCGIGLYVNAPQGGSVMGIFAGEGSDNSTAIASDTCRMVIQQNGNVGIGTGLIDVAATEKLEVVGNIKATNGTISATTMSVGTITATTISASSMTYTTISTNTLDTSPTGQTLTCNAGTFDMAIPGAVLKSQFVRSRATNYIELNSASLQTGGTDTNIDLFISPKGAGKIKTGPIIEDTFLYAGTAEAEQDITSGKHMIWRNSTTGQFYISFNQSMTYTHVPLTV